jgi:hypothetical protein
MNPVETIRSACRRSPILGWLALGLLLLFGLLLLAMGLKSGPTVEGMILLDGQPLPKGSIRLVPVEGTSGSDTGSPIHRGKFSDTKG